jgi:hypothetical protein
MDLSRPTSFRKREMSSPRVLCRNPNFSETVTNYKTGRGKICSRIRRVSLWSCFPQRVYLDYENDFFQACSDTLLKIILRS